MYYFILPFILVNLPVSSCSSKPFLWFNDDKWNVIVEKG